ncbi:hypothetical protein SacmaDRAFT_0272 [Saccharomonospora marina XMU15]|uniref:Uncharacterized protein n=1 Tax=Saccharomonospora marina XMU15 TaxID=882083 RepID=H5X0C2_9PSEU|nr:hypothetical protein [Saccharomonospora marina]EHR48582.1 hypothetical protein SacmaDRAFT_0272 [Saccharomonospora marina XMU15]
MGWQEQLRRLDAELAQGGITVEQHRRQREEVLAEASGIPEPPRAGTAPATERDQAERKPGSSSLLDTDVPTTAPSPADERATDSMPYPKAAPPTPAELTLPITKVPTTPAANVKQQAQRAAPSPPPQRAGGRRTWLLIGFAVLVSLAVVIGGAWWFGVVGGEPTRGHAVAGSKPDQPRPALDDRLPTLPGRPSPHNSTMSVSRGVELGLYPAAQADAMRRSGAEEVVYRSSAEGPDLTDGYTVLVVPTPSARQASELTDSLTRSVTAEGFEPSPLPDEPDVTVLSRADSASRVSVVWYVSDGNAVGVGVSQSADSPESELRQRLRDTLHGVQRVLPRS